MRRRARLAEVAPPARLRQFVCEDWLPLVDPSDYRPERYRNIRAGEPYGPPHVTQEAWVRQEACALWTRARIDWMREHGWPGRLDAVDLIREARELRRGRPG